MFWTKNKPTSVPETIFFNLKCCRQLRTLYKLSQSENRKHTPLAALDPGELCVCLWLLLHVQSSTGGCCPLFNKQLAQGLLPFMETSGPEYSIYLNSFIPAKELRFRTLTKMAFFPIVGNFFLWGVVKDSSWPPTSCYSPTAGVMGKLYSHSELPANALRDCGRAAQTSPSLC